MTVPSRPRSGVDALDRNAIVILEEALQLLREAPARAFFCYALGTLPFVAGFLWFWADMGRGAFAASRCLPASMALAALFVWMKAAQSEFAAILHRHLLGSTADAVTHADRFRAAMTHAAWQAVGFLLIPLAFIATIPFCRVYGFFQHLTILAARERTNRRELAAKARAQALLWMMQQHLMLLALLFFSAFVFVDIAIMLLLIPEMARIFLGVEGPYAMSGFHLFNTTFLAACAALTYVCVDPIQKAAYVLRGFYADSLRSGADLFAAVAARGEAP